MTRMNIAISIPEYDNHLQEIPYLLKLTEYLLTHHPNMTLLLLLEKDSPKVAMFAANPQVVVWLKVPPRKNFMATLWFRHFRLKRLLRRQRINVFVSHDQSVKTNDSLYQMLWIDNMARLMKQTAALNRVQQIIATDEWLCDRIKEKSGTNAEVITTGFEQAFNTDNQEIKNKYTDGRDYFCCHALDLRQEQLITLLKGFSAFKKMQRSGMKLLLLLDTEQEKNIVASIANYKYKEDVVCIVDDDVQERQALIASAYANIFLQNNISVNQGMMASISAGVPIITDHEPAMQSAFEEVAAFSEKTEKDIAKNLMEIYKDETWRQSLINMGYTMAAARSWNEVMSRFNTLIPSADS